MLFFFIDNHMMQKAHILSFFKEAKITEIGSAIKINLDANSSINFSTNCHRSSILKFIWNLNF